MTPLPLDIAIRATLILGAAGLADACLRRRGSAAARHLTWSLAVAALLVLPIASSTLPHWTLRIPAGRPAGVAPANLTPTTNCDPAGPKACATAAGPATSLIDDAVADRGGDTRSGFMPALAALVGIYIAGALLLLARVSMESIALRRVTRDAQVVVEAAWIEMLEDAARELGVGSRVRLLRSAREIMPLTFGTLAPAIVVPASAAGWPDDRRRAVLLHELAHVARRDCFVQRLTAAACAFYWPHPGVWWAARRLRVERELACDDRVLAAGAAAREYAGHLLDLAHTLGSAPAPATALGMARPRQLERRLLAVLDSARNRAALHSRGRTIAIAIAIGVLVPLAALRPAVVPAQAAALAAAMTIDAPFAASPQTAAGQDLAGTWELRLSRDPGMVQVTVRTEHANHGRSLRLDQIPGISLEQISAASSTVQLPIRREAGTFTVDGVCRRGVCGGTFVFEPSQTFASELTRRGLARPTPQQQMDLAIADVGIAYLDALKAAGYATPDLATIVRAAQHGVDAGYLREMTELGYRLGTLDALTTLRDHGVDPHYVRGMAASGYSKLTVDQLLEARDHGVDPGYVQGMRDLGYRAIDLAALITTRDHGVDPSYVHSMQAHGYRLTVEEATRARDHGVDASYVDGLAKLGYDKLTLEELLRARDHGVDPAYVREMSELGYKGVPLDALIRMRDHGVDAAFVRRLQQRGAGHLSVDEIIERRDRGSDDPDAAARAMAYHVQHLWHSLVTWLCS